jgi:hypothetical protein
MWRMAFDKLRLSGCGKGAEVKGTLEKKIRSA